MTLATDVNDPIQINIVLDSAPQGNEYHEISFYSTDPDVGIAQPSILRFTSSNWNVPQTIRVISTSSGSKLIKYFITSPYTAQVKVGQIVVNVNSNSVPPVYVVGWFSTGGESFEGSTRSTWKATCGETINDLVINNGVFYVGGGFSYIGGKAAPTLARLNSDGILDETFPGVFLRYYNGVGNLTVGVEDGAGNLYFAGNFDHVNGQPLTYAAAVNSSGTLLGWAPSFDSTINNMIIDGGVIYFGGFFSNVNSQTRNYAAAVNTSGVLQPWNPNPNSSVYALVKHGSFIYIGGDFTTVSGTGRTLVAAVDTNTGALQSWNPTITGFVVSTIASNPTDNVIYIGGQFTQVNSTARANFAAITAGGALTTPVADTNSNVTDIKYNNGKIYISGFFGTVNSQARVRFAVITTAGVLSSFNANADQTPDHVFFDSSNNAYIIGQFTLFGGSVRIGAASIDSSETLRSWNPSLQSSSHGHISTGNKSYIFGSFAGAGAIAQQYLAAFDVNGNITSWLPTVDDEVYALAVYNDIIYAGGAFVVANGQTRKYACAFNTSGVLQSWNPDLDDQVDVIRVFDGNIYMGGLFNVWHSSDPVGPPLFNGTATTRNFALAMTPAGALLPWNPNFDYVVRDMVELDASNIVCVGEFTSNAGFTLDLDGLAKTSKSNGTIDTASFNPKADRTPGVAQIHSAVIHNGIIYFGGNFDVVNTITRNYLAAVNTSGVLQSWYPQPNDRVQTLYFDSFDNTIYVGGAFTTVNGQSRNFAANVDLSGNLTSWNPGYTFTTYVYKFAKQ